jgi:hypothetical protein
MMSTTVRGTIVVYGFVGLRFVATCNAHALDTETSKRGFNIGVAEQHEQVFQW